MGDFVTARSNDLIDKKIFSSSVFKLFVSLKQKPGGITIEVSSERQGKSLRRSISKLCELERTELWKFYISNLPQCQSVLQGMEFADISKLVVTYGSIYTRGSGGDLVISEDF